MPYKKFNEFVSERDGVTIDPSKIQMDQEDLLKRLVRTHGAGFRDILKNAIRNNEIEDEEMLNDLKELIKMIGMKADSSDQYPIRDKTPRKEPDVVSRPKADGGSGQNSGDGGGE